MDWLGERRAASVFQESGWRAPAALPAQSSYYMLIRGSSTAGNRAMERAA
jgi:hypothetical protein